ncbi:helix-turn-helix transcriptional regulator [Streptosporangium sp. NPDC006007]|uniref:helix-turn-helix domain-containing protein n=1 Tax=Streptosporangium sp. NPDC006007 TaxID=3154575 RepID=UPI0033BB7325
MVEMPRSREEGTDMTGNDWDPDLGSDFGEHTGQRIARVRKHRGLSQQALAAKAKISYSLLSKVESGHKVASAALVAAVARALSEDRAKLDGRPRRGGERRPDAAHLAIPEIRRVIACIDMAPEPEVPPRSLDELTAERNRARVLLGDAAHARLGALLPASIEELTAHVAETGDPRAWRLLSNMLSLAFALSRRLGYHDLGQVALERASHAAGLGDDPNLPHIADLSRALQLFTVGSWPLASRLMRQTAGRIDQSRPGALHVLTAVHLRGAVAAALAAHGGDAWEHHALATEAVLRIPGGHRGDPYGLQANTSNVQIHGCTVAIEMGDYDQAIKMDERLVFSPPLSAARRAHHEIDMARALTQAGRADRALKRLFMAEKVAPEMIRFHATARRVVRQLSSHYRIIPESLRRLENRMSL